MVKYRDYEVLHEHPGNDKYEIETIIKPGEKVKKVLFDSLKTDLIIQAKYDPVKPEDYYAYTLKISSTGSEIDSSKTNRIIEDGTNWYREEYNEWLINGDTSKHAYIRLLTEKQEKDSDQWMDVFRDLYSKASSVYIYEGLGEYYFKVDNDWYKLGYNEAANNVFNERFPAKFANVRIVALEDHTPDFSRGPTQRDTILWTYHGYEEGDREEGVGLDPINFSAGWHYLQLKMPGSEPLKIKRYGSMGVNIHTYIIPDSLGGRNDVAFIVQEPSSLFPNQEFGGMYVVRPRELNK